MIQRNGNIFHALWLEELILLKLSNNWKQSTDLRWSLSNSQDIFHRTRINNPKIHMKLEKSRIAKVILRREEKTAGCITLSDFRQYYKATKIKTVWYWNKTKNMHEWNGIDNPEIIPCTYGQLIFYKGGKNIQWEKVSTTSGVGKAGQPHVNQWS